MKTWGGGDIYICNNIVVDLVGFEVLTYNIMLASESQQSKQQTGSACCLLHAGFLLGLFFNPEDGGDMFFPKQWLTLAGTQHYIPEDRTLHS
jgi:hypothetical protein